MTSRTAPRSRRACSCCLGAAAALAGLPSGLPAVLRGLRPAPAAAVARTPVLSAQPTSPSVGGALPVAVARAPHGGGGSSPPSGWSAREPAGVLKGVAGPSSSSSAVGSARRVEPPAAMRVRCVRRGGGMERARVSSAEGGSGERMACTPSARRTGPPARCWLARPTRARTCEPGARWRRRQQAVVSSTGTRALLLRLLLRRLPPSAAAGVIALRRATVRSCGCGRSGAPRRGGGGGGGAPSSQHRRASVPQLNVAHQLRHGGVVSRQRLGGGGWPRH